MHRKLSAAAQRVSNTRSAANKPSRPRRVLEKQVSRPREISPNALFQKQKFHKPANSVQTRSQQLKVLRRPVRDIGTSIRSQINPIAPNLRALIFKQGVRSEQTRIAGVRFTAEYWVPSICHGLSWPQAEADKTQGGWATFAAFGREARLGGNNGTRTRVRPKA